MSLHIYQPPKGVLASTLTNFEAPKFHDAKREPGEHQFHGVNDEREPMVSELNGKAIWLSTQAFQQELVPRPPSDLMLSQTEIDALRERLKVMVNSVPERAGLEKRKEEHVLAEGFVSTQFDP